METIALTPSMPFPLRPANYDEVSMQQSMVLSDSLKDLKNIRKQLYAAAEYFEFSFSSGDQKQEVMSTLKDYAVKALVNTVDHLCSVSYKTNDLLDEMINEVSGTELRVSCIRQRLRTCWEYIDREGLSQQSLVITIPKYHKQYIVPAMRAAVNETPPLHVTVSKRRALSSSPRLAQQSYSFSRKLHHVKDLEERTISPRHFPLLRSGSISGKPTTSKSSDPSTPSKSRATTPSPSLENQQEGSKDSERNASSSKVKHLLKALLTRRKSKKDDDALYTYLDEY